MRSFIAGITGVEHAETMSLPHTLQYLRDRQYLRELWENRQYAYGVLGDEQQWRIYAFYRPYDTLTAVELLDYRRAVKTLSPALPLLASATVRHLRRRIDTNVVFSLDSQQAIRVRSGRAILEPSQEARQVAEVYTELAYEESITPFLNLVHY
jgi:hypothetical protein